MANYTKNVQVSTSETQKRCGRIYRVSGNLFICKATSRVIPHNFIGCTRGNVDEFTAGAAGRMRRYLRECVASYSVMITLTYPGFFSSNGQEVKEHLRRFLQELKRRVDREGESVISYSSFWFLEFQARSAPHFHIFTTHEFPFPFVSMVWYRIVNSEDPRHLHAGTRVEALRKGRSGLISYAQKYANKQDQKKVPAGYEKVGRFWGVSGYRATMSADTFVSKADLKIAGVKSLENKLKEALDKGIHNAEVEVYKREHGIGIYVLYSHAITLTLRLLVSRLSAQTMKLPQMFADSDLNIEV